jgi:hypothetical protein
MHRVGSTSIQTGSDSGANHEKCLASQKKYIIFFGLLFLGKKGADDPDAFGCRNCGLHGGRGGIFDH